MSTGNVVAWLTCLILAFFACVLSVRNLGTALHLEKEMARLERKVEGMSERPKEGISAELARIRRSLDNVAAELQEIEQSELPDAPEDLKARLKELEALLRDLNEALTDASGQDAE